jgi:Helicase conserved C-terminal domain/DEAD/DEAH box helicase
MLDPTTLSAARQATVHFGSDHQAIVGFKAGTGVGKTTALPFVLAEAGGFRHVIVTSPTRLSAVSTGKYVKNKTDLCRGFKVHVAISGKPPLQQNVAGRDIQYSTIGIAVKNFSTADLLVMDEVHIINPMMVSMLLMIKQMLALSVRVPKTLLLSATLPDLRGLGLLSSDVPVFEGMNETPYAVTVNFLERYHIRDMLFCFQDCFPAIAGALISTLKKASSASQHAIILPGIGDIVAFEKYYDNNYRLVFRKLKFFVLTAKDDPESALHNLAKVTSRCNENGVHVVVLATDVIEASITLPSVTNIIDTGVKKTRVHDGLCPVAVSITNSAQRRGRVGRVAPGEYTALFFRSDLLAHNYHTQPLVDATSILEVTAYYYKGIDVRQVYRSVVGNLQLIADFERLYHTLLDNELIDESTGTAKITQFGYIYLQMKVYHVQLATLMIQAVYKQSTMSPSAVVLMLVFLYVLSNSEMDLFDIPERYREQGVESVEMFSLMTYRKWHGPDDLATCANILVPVSEMLRCDEDEIWRFCNENAFKFQKLKDFVEKYEFVCEKLDIRPHQCVQYSASDLLYLRQILLPMFLDNIMVFDSHLRVNEFIGTDQTLRMIDPRLMLCNPMDLKQPDHFVFCIARNKNTTTAGDVTNVARLNLSISVESGGLPLGKKDELVNLIKSILITEEERRAQVRALNDLLRESAVRQRPALRHFVARATRVIKIRNGAGDEPVTQTLLPRICRSIISSGDPCCIAYGECAEMPLKSVALLRCRHWTCLDCWGMYLERENENSPDSDQAKCPTCRMDQTYCVYKYRVRKEETEQVVSLKERKFVTDEYKIDLQLKEIQDQHNAERRKALAAQAEKQRKEQILQSKKEKEAKQKLRSVFKSKPSKK